MTEADDLALAKWAAHQVYLARRGWTTRTKINAELNGMTEQKRERARYWLNHYRQESKA